MSIPPKASTFAKPVLHEMEWGYLHKEMSKQEINPFRGFIESNIEIIVIVLAFI